MTDDALSTGVELREGDLLAGKYRILKLLGRGGMGMVFSAHHVHLGEKVALKLLLPELAGNRELVARFTREARAAVKIKSEHVVRTIDVGALESGSPFIVMEFLEGEDLDSLLSQRGSLLVEEAVEFVLQACEAIAEAHGYGIIHRDLKPANLFVTRRADGTPSIKVLDFGISKMIGSSAFEREATMTKTAAVMGSPQYMSPEQLQSSRDVDQRTDIWALGVILYELLVGAVPFTGASFSELCIKIATQPVPAPRSSRGDIPRALERAVCKCLEKDRTQRYGNVAEFALDLAPFASVRARQSVDRIVGILRQASLPGPRLPNVPLRNAQTADEQKSDTVNPWGLTLSRVIRPGKKTLLTVGAALLIVAAITAMALRSPNTQQTPSVGSLALENPPQLAPSAPGHLIERQDAPAPNAVAEARTTSESVPAPMPNTTRSVTPAASVSPSVRKHVEASTLTAPRANTATQRATPSPPVNDAKLSPTSSPPEAVGTAAPSTRRSVYDDRK